MCSPSRSPLTPPSPPAPPRFSQCTRSRELVSCKDAFFCIHLAPASQPIFAFEWEDLIGGNEQQLTWTRLLQGFKNAPTIFGVALASDLEAFQPERYGCWLLQYVDDLLLAAETWEECWEGTQALLQLLAEAEYRVSRKKITNLQGGSKVFGVCLKGRHKVARPI